MKSSKQKRVSAIGPFDPPAETHTSKPSKRVATVKAWIEAKPGAEGMPFTPRKNSIPLIVIYKIMGKMFAILSLRGIEDVILKCDPGLASALRQEYSGVGHRSHLDRRFWVSVRLNADVPTREIKRLVSLSYDLVCAGLTVKQRAELARLTPRKNVIEAD
jgi:predicted DNA-binding protein (MmcQ/YjbR family)